jgi:hypothetical protein
MSKDLENKNAKEELFGAKTPDHVLKEYLERIDSLVETVNSIMIIVSRARKRARSDYEIFIAPLRKALKDDDGEAAAEFVLEHGLTISKLSKSRRKATIAFEIVPRTFLVSLVSIFDAFLSELITAMFALRPEKLFSSKKVIDAQSLFEMSSRDDALQHFLEQEIDEVLRKSHLEQLVYMGKTFDFTMNLEEPLVIDFIEITERRNLFVHAGGVVNRTYVQKCSEAGVKLPDDLHIGNSLGANRKYILRAEQILYEVGVKLTHISWRKLKKSETEPQHKMLHDVYFRLLEEKRYELARCIADFAITDQDADESDRRLHCINQCIAYKFGGRPEEVERLLNRFNWGTTSIKFKVALAILRDDFERALSLIKHVPEDVEDGILKDAYRTWPLFEEARSRDDFREAFRDKFGEDLIQPPNPALSLDSGADLAIATDGLQASE